MMRTLAVVGVLFSAGTVHAQDIDFTSEQNRVWWNGVTPNELQELAIEAGATHTFVSDNGEVVISRLDWPDLPNVAAWQGGCDWSSGSVDRDGNCTDLLLIYETDLPSQMDIYRQYSSIWLRASVGDDGRLRLNRYEEYGFGTARGAVLADLLRFRTYVKFDLDAIRELGL